MMLSMVTIGEEPESPSVADSCSHLAKSHMA